MCVWNRGCHCFLRFLISIHQPHYGQWKFRVSVRRSVLVCEGRKQPIIRFTCICVCIIVPFELRVWVTPKTTYRLPTNSTPFELSIRFCPTFEEFQIGNKNTKIEFHCFRSKKVVLLACSRVSFVLIVSYRLSVSWNRSVVRHFTFRHRFRLVLVSNGTWKGLWILIICLPFVGFHTHGRTACSRVYFVA